MFEHMTLKTKIGGGFTIVIILTLIISVIGWNGIRTVANQAEIADDANRMIKFILESRRYEKNFIIRGMPLTSKWSTSHSRS